MANAQHKMDKIPPPYDLSVVYYMKFVEKKCFILTGKFFFQIPGNGAHFFFGSQNKRRTLTSLTKN
jgi:hypothetical protein